MIKYVTLIVFTLLFISQGILAPVSAQWIPYEIDADAGDVRVLYSADIDGDGDLDITATGYSRGDILWYENDSLTWVKHTIDTEINGPITAFPADIDNDGRMDVVIQGTGEHKVFWYKNNLPDTVWTQNVIDPLLTGAEGIAVADLDNDGDMDVVASGFRAGDVVWYENDTLTWNESTIDNYLSAANGVDFADIDGDGDLDIVATGTGANDVVWYENNLPGTVWNKKYIDTNLAGAFVIDTGDIDGDGDIDVAVAGRDANVVNWYENNDSTWITHTIDDKFPNASILGIADFDNDDKPDIVATPYGTGVLKWYKNTLPTWEENIIDTNPGFRGLGVGDLDSDGFMDVIAENGGMLSWYHNQPNVALVKSLQSQPKLISPQGETLSINSRLYNPKDHQVVVMAIIHGDQYAFTDSLQLYDDGEHNDSLASDNLYGNSKWLSDLPEDNYTIEVSSYDVIEDFTYNLPPLTSFTSIGPIKVDSLSSVRQSTFDPARIVFDIYLGNNGSTATAKNINAIISPDTSHDCFVSTGSLYRDFGDIAPGESKVGQNFNLYLDEYCIEDSIVIIPFTIDILSDGIVFWSDQYELVVNDIEDILTTQPKRFKLGQNYPNPFNPKTIINYELPITNNVELSIFNLLGQEVVTLVNEQKRAGSHQAEWDANGFPSGVYYYWIETGEFQDVKKMILIK